MSDAWITAAFGVFGTLAGGGLTGFVGARQARRQQEVHERTQIRALVAEHHRWRLERRRDAYVAYLVAANEARRTFVSLRGALLVEPCEEASVRAAVEAFPQAVQGIRPLGMIVALEGPASVADAARDFTRIFVQLWEYVQPSLINAGAAARQDFLQRAGEALTELTEAERKFIAAAQPVLENGGAGAMPDASARVV
ncbi:hypothetical protein ABZX77_30155 [Streptomyces sp. NPDC004237]|uniref:hypothetical protein n=1 Tax=Streptomyces sp. NPDC004237 TaxID=3154455 RepID=UPI0033AD5C30